MRAPRRIGYGHSRHLQSASDAETKVLPPWGCDQLDTDGELSRRDRNSDYRKANARDRLGKKAKIGTKGDRFTAQGQCRLTDERCRTRSCGRDHEIHVLEQVHHLIVEPPSNALRLDKPCRGQESAREEPIACFGIEIHRSRLESIEMECRAFPVGDQEGGGAGFRRAIDIRRFPSRREPVRPRGPPPQPRPFRQCQNDRRLSRRAIRRSPGQALAVSAVIGGSRAMPPWREVPAIRHRSVPDRGTSGPEGPDDRGCRRKERYPCEAGGRRSA